jgi:hypothetical protein
MNMIKVNFLISVWNSINSLQLINNVSLYSINITCMDSFMSGSYPASLRNVGGSTQVPVRAWNNARKGTWGLPPPVKLERRDMTYYTVSMWRKTQNKQTKLLPVFIWGLRILLLYLNSQVLKESILLNLTWKNASNFTIIVPLIAIFIFCLYICYNHNNNNQSTEGTAFVWVSECQKGEGCEIINQFVFV